MGALEAGASAYVPKTRVTDDLLDTPSTLGRFGSAHPESTAA
jgi:hypothetical protein